MSSATSEADRRVADTIRVAAQRRRVPQRELGDAAGLSQSQVSKVLLGKRPMAVGQMVAMCAAVGVDPADAISAAVRGADGRA